MRHSPEADAASYLSGDMAGRRRRAFEQHVLECEECWREVDAARKGRSLAESGRELAPPHLREGVRAAVSASTPAVRSRRPLVVALGAAAVLVLAFGVVLLTGEEPPEELEILVADFEGAALVDESSQSQLPVTLGDLELVRSERGSIKGMSVVVHRYQDEAGHEVAVYQSARAFPHAPDAEYSHHGSVWSAEIDGRTIWCTEEPTPSLLVGDDWDEVVMAATELGLR